MEDFQVGGWLYVVCCILINKDCATLRLTTEKMDSSLSKRISSTTVGE